MNTTSRTRLLVLTVLLAGVVGALETVLYPSDKDAANMFYAVAAPALLNMCVSYWILFAEARQRRRNWIGMLIGGLLGLSGGLQTHGLALHTVFDVIGCMLVGGMLASFFSLLSLFDRSMWHLWRLAIVAALVGGLLGLGIGLLQAAPPDSLWTWTGTGAALLPLLVLVVGPFITWPRLPGTPLGWPRMTVPPKYAWPAAKPIDEATKQAIYAEARRHRELLDQQRAKEG